MPTELFLKTAGNDGCMTKVKRTNALTARVVGRDVLLECACGFTLRQELRAVIEERCPRCARWWRR
jgi:hypothetical protein